MNHRWSVTNKANKIKMVNTNLQIQIHKTEGANTNQGAAGKESSSYIGAVAQWGANLA